MDFSQVSKEDMAAISDESKAVIRIFSAHFNERFDKIEGRLDKIEADIREIKFDISRIDAKPTLWEHLKDIHIANKNKKGL